ncbi:MAG: hypothetical protein HQK76_09955 [Desulfobacterales bacterium]|nr:hypothetical protein [Desulfobacterales bacterium]
MIKKFLLIFNLIIGLLFSYKGYSLYKHVYFQNDVDDNFKNYQIVKIERPTVEPINVNDFRKIFDILPEPVKATENTEKDLPVISEPAVEEEDILKIKGIFISAKGKHAVISLNKGKSSLSNQDGSILKVSEGDMIKDLKIVKIAPFGLVLIKTLSDEEISDEIVLKIFKSLVI